MKKSGAMAIKPTGAVVAAAILIGMLRRYGRKVGAILSGGNMALEVLREVLTDK